MAAQSGNVYLVVWTDGRRGASQPGQLRNLLWLREEDRPLQEGEVEVRTSNEAGRDVRIAALSVGAVIGEMAALDGGPRSADVDAARRCRLLGGG